MSTRQTRARVTQNRLRRLRRRDGNRCHDCASPFTLTVLPSVKRLDPDGGRVEANLILVCFPCAQRRNKAAQLGGRR